MTASALGINAVSRNFGALKATDNVSLELARGARHALIGPNGAGKTTLINLITGSLKPSSGRILINDHDVTQLNPEQRVKRGLGRTFQINQLFSGLSVVENMLITLNERDGIGSSPFRRSGGNRELIDQAMAILASLGIADLATSGVAELAYGQQRMLEIAIALALRPAVLLLDEPAAGVPEAERAQLGEVLAALPDETAVLVIEHDMEFVFRFADAISVLVNGSVIASGNPLEIAANETVRTAYLGSSLSHHDPESG